MLTRTLCPILAAAVMGCDGGHRAPDAAQTAPIADAPPSSVSMPTPDGMATTTADAAASLQPPPRPTSDWCVEGLSALDDDVCYVLPPLAADKPRRLLIYLHGIVPPTPDSPQKHTVEKVVFDCSVRAGAAALVPRGRRGLGPAAARDWWGWPTATSTILELTPFLVRRWADAKKKLEAIAGAPFERTYLAGSSSGAYFVAGLATNASLFPPDFPVDGFGAISGGGIGARGVERLSASQPRPFYVGFGTYDEDTKAKALMLVSALKTGHWPVRAAEHPFGHGAKEVYLDEAFALWDEGHPSPVTDSGP